MRKWFFALILILCLLLPRGVYAQDPLVLSSLQIQIWPEYDQPSVLVIYQMALSAFTTPAAVSVRIPVEAGEPNAVAALQADGQLINLDYSLEVAGDWATIVFTTSTPEVQLEYYDPGLTKEGNSRHFQYEWPGDYAISQLTIQVQQPATATDMRISPSLGAGISGTDQLTYFTQDIGSISAGQTIHITLDYQKSDDVLSAENFPVQPSAPIPESTVTDLDISTWLPWILGILGTGLIVGGIVWFWHTGRQRPERLTHRRRSRAGSQEVQGNSTSADEAVYCSQCGKRALPGDLFCRSCGTQIRAK